MSKRLALLATAAALALAVVAPAPAVYAQMAEKTVTVGGAPMYPSKNIIQNAVNSKDHTTLVAAVNPQARRSRSSSHRDTVAFRGGFSDAVTAA